MHDASPPRHRRPLEDKTFLWLLVAVTLALGWILLPFYGAVFWGMVLAILFAPLNRWMLRRMAGRPTSAALVTLSVIVLIVIIPLLMIGAALAREGASLYARMQSGDISFASYFEQVVAALPPWVGRLLERFGLGDMSGLREQLTAGATAGGRQIAARALGIGQNAFDFVIGFFITLYLAFFLLRDGAALVGRIRAAVPLDASTQRELSAKFATVIRATVKGNVLVAAVQGALGGLAFWVLGVHAALLWAVLMAFLSLLPAIGAALVWAPVALWFLVTGVVWKGAALIAFGVLVIGLVDNLLRPVLVGKDIRMPDYAVLISTLGGMAVFGLNGFVIGPVIAAMFMAAWDIFAQGRQPAESPGSTR